LKKLTESDIARISNEQALEIASRMRNPKIIPTFVVIDVDNEGRIDTVSQPSYNHLFGNKYDEVNAKLVIVREGMLP